MDGADGGETTPDDAGEPPVSDVTDEGGPLPPANPDLVDGGEPPPPLPSDDIDDAGLCPDSPPALDSACDQRGLLCTYGDAVDPACRERFYCNFPTDVWIASSGPGGGICRDPATLDACETPADGECSTAGKYCVQGSEICFCAAAVTQICGGVAGGADVDGCQPLNPPIPQQWSCPKPYAAEEGCPESAPHAGRACDDESFSCLYGDDCSGLIVRCEDGYYQWDQSACP
jgi:hypothetical protein